MSFESNRKKEEIIKNDEVTKRLVSGFSGKI